MKILPDRRKAGNHNHPAMVNEHVLTWHLLAFERASVPHSPYSPFAENGRPIMFCYAKSSRFNTYQNGWEMWGLGTALEGTGYLPTVTNSYLYCHHTM